MSGGLDSATVLALARSQGRGCHALSVDYGQRHACELRAAERIAAEMEAVEHRVIRVELGQFGGSALTDDDIPIPDIASHGIPITYVPARNTIMLAIGLGWCEVLGADELHIGVNAVDYSGYPDCRPEYIEQFQRLSDLATQAGVEGRGVSIVAPLIRMSKEEIIRTGSDLGVDFSRTVSCYQPDDQGRACGSCDACRIRRDGFADAGFPDPTRYKN